MQQDQDSVTLLNNGTGLARFAVPNGERRKERKNSREEKFQTRQGKKHGESGGLSEPILSDGPIQSESMRGETNNYKMRGRIPGRGGYLQYRRCQEDRVGELLVVVVQHKCGDVSENVGKFI